MNVPGTLIFLTLLNWGLIGSIVNNLLLKQVFCVLGEVKIVVSYLCCGGGKPFTFKKLPFIL